MKKMKLMTAVCLAVLMILLGSVTAAAAEYTSSGVTFSVPYGWKSWGVNLDLYKNKGYYSYAISQYSDGLVEYSVEFKYKNDCKMKFGAKDLFASSDTNGCKREEYQTEDFLNELLASVKNETAETTVPMTLAATDDSATADESVKNKRVITGSQDKFYLASMYLLGTPELIDISGTEFIYQHRYDRDIYSHVHNGVLYQFRDDGAGKEEMQQVLATLRFSEKQTVLPTTSIVKNTTDKNSSSKSGSSFGLILMMFGSIAVSAIINAINRKRHGIDGNKRTISIRLVTPEESSSGSDENSDSENKNDES